MGLGLGVAGNVSKPWLMVCYTVFIFQTFSAHTQQHRSCSAMDSDSDDDNVHFGTPLEPLEDGKDIINK